MFALVVSVSLTLAACGGTPRSSPHPRSPDDAVKVIANIPYTSGSCPGGSAQVERLDAYLPAPSQAQPTAAVVLIHGGGFVEGSKTMAWYPGIARQLASEGWAAFSIDYCLPPEWPLGAHPGYPAELQNVEAATRWLAVHADSYHVDPAKIVLWGGSAGATLALEAGAALASSGNFHVAATVGWSGGYDLFDLRGATASSLDFVWDYLGCNPGTPACKATASRASAALNVTAGTPPAFLANSAHEQTPGVPLYQLNDMANALASAKIRAATLILPGSRHAVEYTDDAYCPTIRFLQDILGLPRGACTPPATPF
jgi:acetyl esterase/lipase